MNKQAVIIGAGPAGISAAIYLVRAGVETTVVYRDMGALGKTSAIENYYGFAEPVSGPALFEAGVAQASRLGVKIVRAEVVGLEWGAKIEAVTDTDRYPGDVIVIATGASRVAPKIPGLRDLEGYGVSYCAICDAFFYRGKDVAVIGSGAYALHEASILSSTANHVTICTNGAPVSETSGPVASNVSFDTARIARLASEAGTPHELLSGVEFEDGRSLDVAGVFVAVGVAGSADFARKVGARVDGARIVTDQNCATTIPGLYACGDCAGGLLQVSKAVCDGALAGTAAAKYLKTL